MEIVVRAIVIFVFLWVITRIVGRATLGELSTFELILFVTMGDLIQGAVVGQDHSVTGGMLAVGTFALLTIALASLNVRARRLRLVTQGQAVLVVQDGTPLIETMRAERLSPEDLLAAARTQGIEQIGDIRLGILEANGQLSFFTSSSADDGATELPDAG